MLHPEGYLGREMVDSTIKAFVFTVGPPAGVSFGKREGNARPRRGGVCVCVCIFLGGDPQLKEHHGGSDHEKTDHFIWEFEGAGRDSSFWLTKTMPRENRLPKITAEETCFFFFLKEEEGGLLALRVENNRQRLF